MEKSVQTLLVHANGGDGGDKPRNSTESPRTQRTSSCSSQSCRLSEFWRFLLLPEVTFGCLSLKEKALLSLLLTIRYRFPVSYFAAVATLSIKTRQTSNLQLGIGLALEKALSRVSLLGGLDERSVESAARNRGAPDSRRLWRSRRGAWRASTRGSKYKRSARESGAGVRPQGLAAGGQAPVALSCCICYLPLSPLYGARGLRSPLLCSAAAGWARGAGEGAP